MKRLIAIFSFTTFIFKMSLLFAIAGSEVSQEFISENELFFELKNKQAVLQLNKRTGIIELFGIDKKQRFSEYKSPEFHVNGVCLKQNTEKISLTDRTDKKAILSIPSEQGIFINLSIEKAGDFGFTLKYYSDNADINKIKGVIRLNMVEEIYGFGETWNKHLAQRGQAFDVWDKGGTPDECAWMPYFVSTNNYAFFINYGGLVSFDVGQRKADELTYEFTYHELEYTLIAGDDIASSVQNFVALTGMPAKPPRWSFEPWFWLMSDPDIPGGNISTLKGEHSVEMVEKLNKLNIPVGVTWFEPPWQDARTSFIPNNEFSSDIKGLITRLDSFGVKTLAWTVPYTSPGASNWEEAVNQGYLVKKPDGGIDNSDIKITKSGELEGKVYNEIDFYNPEAYKWWQQQIESAIDLGLKGFKLDAGQGLAKDAILYDGRKGKDVHNSIALEYNRVFYESLKNKLGDDFLMIPRAAWIGSGAYTNFKWPGDLSGSFANNGLPSSVYSSLSLAFSGIPFISTDIGGFSDQPAPEEPWIRWAQFGAMLPGMQTLHMPWWYSEKALEHFRYLAWLHTDLIPYWETLANEAHQTGTPVCRPLVWSYEKDTATWRIDDEFTVGEFILVAPMMNPERMRDVYIPEGIWYDFWDNDIVFEGKQKVNWFKGWKQSTWMFPLYIKEGAVIPMEIKNSISGFGSEYSEGYITLSMWPEEGIENVFLLNDREGSVPFTTNWVQSKKLNINWEHSKKDYMFRIHINHEKPISKILSKKTSLTKVKNLNDFQKSKFDSWFFDSENKKLWIKKLNDENTGYLDIHFE